MSFRRHGPYNRPQEMEAGQRNYATRDGLARPSRSFNWKDRQYSGEKSGATGDTGNSSAQSSGMNKHKYINKNANNYRSYSNFYQSSVAQQMGNAAVGLNLNNTLQGVSVPNLHPSVSQGFSLNESYIYNAENTASNSTTGQVDNNESKVKLECIKNESMPRFTKQKKIHKKNMVKLNDLSVRKLQSQEGIDFLQKLSDESKVKITIIQQGKKKKFAYACTLKGAKRAIPQVKESIKNYCLSLLKDAKLLEAEPFDLMKGFQGEKFNITVLQESLSKLENPNINWIKLTFYLHKKVKETWGKFNAATREVQLGKIKELKNLLKNQYMAFHAVLLGKLDIEDGPLHLAVLKLAVQNGIAKESDEEVVRKSYNYIFRSSKRLDIDYPSVIKRLPPHVSLQTEMDDLYKSGTSICEKNNMKRDLGLLKCAYNSLIYCHYSERKIFQFRKLCDDINERSGK